MAIVSCYFFSNRSKANQMETETDPLRSYGHCCWTTGTAGNSRRAFRRRKIRRAGLACAWSPSPTSGIHNLCFRCRESTLVHIGDCSADWLNRYRVMLHHQWVQRRRMLTVCSLSNWTSPHCCRRSCNFHFSDLDFGIRSSLGHWSRSMVSSVLGSDWVRLFEPVKRIANFPWSILRTNFINYFSRNCDAKNRFF